MTESAPDLDAIRAVLDKGWVRCDVCLGVSPSWDGHEPGCSEWVRERLRDTLAALAAAHAETERLRWETRADEQANARLRELLDEARAALAALREVHARYFDLGGVPGEDDTTPEPEDVWRYDRDFRAALAAAPSETVPVYEVSPGAFMTVEAAPSETEEGR